MKTVLTLAALVVAIDQVSKALALAQLAGAPVPVLAPCFELRLVHNPGAAWGMLAGRRFVLTGVSAAMLGLLFWNRRDLCATRLSRIASGLLVGGIAGNLVDRVFRTGSPSDNTRLLCPNLPAPLGHQTFGAVFESRNDSSFLIQ